MSSQRSVVGYFWKYNPILNKPTSLEPLRPWGAYFYYGPDPAAGVSYGLYEDADTGIDVVSPDKEVVYSPATGRPMKKTSKMSWDEVQKLVSKATANNSEFKVECRNCSSPLWSNADVSEAETLHCSLCGQNIQERKQEEQTMAMSQEKMQALKEKIRASIEQKRESEKEKSGLERKKALAAKIRERLKAKRAEAEKAQAEEEEYVDLDDIMEAMEKVKEEEDKNAAKCGPDYAAGEEDENPELQEDQGAMEDEKEGGERPAEGEEEEAGESAEEQKAADKGEDEEEYVDLDMVISYLKRKARVERAKARIKAKKAAAAAEAEKEETKAAKASKDSKKVKAEGEDENPELQEDQGAMEDEKEGGERPAEGEEEEAGEEKASGDEEPNMVDEENPLPAEGDDTMEDVLPADSAPEEMEEAEEMEEDAEAMRYEPLASLEELKSAKAQDIAMELYEDNENPFWNVSVGGVPVAKIALKDQPSADEIRKVFCNTDYADDLIDHCVKGGVVETLKKVNAKFWSNHTSNKKIAEHYQKKAEARYAEEKKQYLSNFRNDFLNSIRTVAAGMNKNYFPEVGNPLKEALMSNLVTVGLPEHTAVSVVEKAFAEASAEHFDALFDKSEEFSGLTKEARKEISKAIAQAPVLEANSDGSLQEAEPATLAERVTQASTKANYLAGQGSGLKVQSNLSMDVEDYKSQLKGTWKPRR